MYNEMMPVTYPYTARESISIASDGVKTNSQLLNGLYALIDTNKLTGNSFITWSSSTSTLVYMLRNITTTSVILSEIDGNNNDISVRNLILNSNSSVIITWSITTSNVANTDYSSRVSPVGNTITLYY